MNTRVTYVAERNELPGEMETETPWVGEVPAYASPLYQDSLTD
jgi:hypothetical protein